MSVVPFPTRPGMIRVVLHDFEIDLLAAAIERDAYRHDREDPCSCPQDLYDWLQRARELRALIGAKVRS